MSENNFKKTYNGFTKFVLWGTIAVIAILIIFFAVSGVIETLFSIDKFSFIDPTIIYEVVPN